MFKKHDTELIHAKTDQIMDSLTQRDKGGKSWICPFCGNGSGRDGTGLYTTDHVHFKCFVCGFSGDVLEIISRKYGLHGRSMFEKAYQLGGITNYIEYDKSLLKTPMRRDKRHSDRVEQIKELLLGQLEYDENNARIIEQSQNNKDGIVYASQVRGIPVSVAKEYEIGGISQFKGISRGALIPLSRDSFNVRNIEPCEKKDRYRKQTGKQNIDIPFNIFELVVKRRELKALFITEGEFDALSIISAGYPAFSFNGNTIERVIDFLSLGKITANVGILTDNDKVGIAKAKSILNMLKQANYHGLAFNRFYEGTGYKDANEFYLKDKAEFESRIKRSYDKLLKAY